MKTVVILNPAAGNGKAGKHKHRIESLIQSIGLDASLIVSSSPAHAMQAAKDAATQSQLIVAVGGDGTIHQVANGILCSKASTILGIIPYGTGNDFVKMLGIPVHLESAIKILAKGKRKAVDYGTLTISTQRGDEQRFFINTLGVGFDAEVSHRASSFKALPGFWAYLAALLSTLRNLHNAEVQIILDGQTKNLLYQGAFLLCSVGNGHTSGGLFKLTPNAAIDDGWFDVCAIERLSVCRLLMSIPKVLRGKHTNMKEYHAGKAKRVTVAVNHDAVDSGLPVHADGEIVAHDVHRLEVQIIEKGISIIVA